MAEQQIKKGQVYWLTGLPGAGKTTIGKALVARLRAATEQVVHLDGDELRQVFDDYGYSREARLKLATQYAKLATLLANQGTTVVVSTVSLFHEIHDLNRENNTHYFEVFVNPPQQVLTERNQKKLYATEDCPVNPKIVGQGITPEFPTDPDLNIDSHLLSVEQSVQQILTATKYWFSEQKVAL